MLALALPAAMREAQHGFAHPKREQGSRTLRPRTVHPTADRSQSGHNDLSATELLRHELLPVRIHGVEGQGQAPVGASENHVADHLHSTAAHFDQGLFQCRSQTEDL